MFIDSIENFLKNYPNIINTLNVMGTISAVITALYLSNRSLKPNVKAVVYLSKIFMPDMNNTSIYSETEEDFISVSVNNIGYVTVFLNYMGSFNWSLPFLKTVLMQLPLSKEKFNENSEFELQSYKSHALLLTKKKEFIEELCKFKNKNKYPHFMLNFLEFRIRTSNNICFKAKIDKNLMKDILDGTK